jgi:hypothetical protein
MWLDFMAIRKKVFYNARRFTLHPNILPTSVCHGLTPDLIKGRLASGLRFARIGS